MMMWIGRWALAVLREASGLARLLGAVLVRAPRVERRELIRHAFEIGNRSVVFVSAIMVFVGATLVLQAGVQAMRIVGDVSTVGPGFLQLLVREFGPTIICLMVAARAGAGIAAELGAMKITDQVDALRISGAEPVAFLVAPRVLGGALGMVPLVIWGSAVAHVAGGFAMTSEYELAWETYLGVQLVQGVDVAVGMSKALAFGFAVPLVACRSGLAAHGGAPGVGRAATRAVIVGSLVVLLLDLIIGVFGYLAGRG